MCSNRKPTRRSETSSTGRHSVFLFACPSVALTWLDSFLRPKINNRALASFSFCSPLTGSSAVVQVGRDEFRTNRRCVRDPFPRGPESRNRRRIGCFNFPVEKRRRSSDSVCPLLGSRVVNPWGSDCSDGRKAVATCAWPGQVHNTGPPGRACPSTESPKSRERFPSECARSERPCG